MKVDSYDSLPLEKTMFFHNVLILIKRVFNKDKNNYYCSIFLEKANTKKISFCVKYEWYEIW